MSLISKINLDVRDAFSKSFGEECVANISEFIEVSKRPDLSDFQSNIAMRMAKLLQKNPRDIAQVVIENLSAELYRNIQIDGPGFINLTVSNELLEEHTKDLYLDDMQACSKVENAKNVVIDYAGPNVAKPLHVGHLRSSIIGEAIKRIFRFKGENVIADIHLGDWGKPMGLIIAEIKERYPDMPYFKDNFSKDESYACPITVDDLAEIYPFASQKAKDDESFSAIAREITLQLQNKHAGYYTLWQHLFDISIADIKKSLVPLNVDFDCWLGESHAHETTLQILKQYKENGLIELSQGAYIIDLQNEEPKPLPPFILEKSDGALLYSSTDMGTLKTRLDEFAAEQVLYVVDARQSLHFEQLFASAKKMSLWPQYGAEHIKFGTVNGSDGKPLKTRDGGVMKLSDLISSAQENFYQTMKERKVISDDVRKVSDIVSISAIKFADLMNPRDSNYQFDLDKFLRFEGKTGVYILYSLSRINSILSKIPAELKNIDIENTKITFSDEVERKIFLQLNLLNIAIDQAYNMRMPHILCDYLYELTQNFNTFYQKCQIAKEPDEEKKTSRIILIKLVKRQIELLCNLLAIDTVESM